MSQSLFGLGLRLAEDDKIIGIAREAQAEFVELPIEVIENDVRQERGNDSPLGRASGGSQKATVLENPTTEKALKEVEHFSICDTLSNGLQDNPMRQVIKEALDISIHDDIEPLGMALESMVDGHVSVAPLDEAKGSCVEERPEDGIEKPANDFLGDPVFDPWNAEGTELGLLSVFGDEYPAQRERHESAAFEFTHEGQQVVREISLEQLDADLIDPGSAPVAFDRLEG